MKWMKEKNEKGSKRPDICLSLSCNSFDELKEELEEYGEYCDIVEWCVDKTEATDEYSKGQFLEKVNELKFLCDGKKLIIDYKGDEATANRILRWAMEGADMIDVDAENSEVTKLVREAKRNKTKVIVSHHVFESMPNKDEIATQFLRMEKTGGDILKIACAADTEADTYQVLEAASAYTHLKNHKPIVAIAMGEEGQASRICAGDFGSIISYSCGSTPTAPGQFNARDLQKYLNIYYEGNR